MTKMRSAAQSLNFQINGLTALRGHLYGMKQRIAHLDAVADLHSTDHGFMHEIYQAIRTHLPPCEFADLDKIALHENGGIANLQIFSALVAGLQEGAGGVVAEHPQIIYGANTDGASFVVRLALPTISPALCIMAAKWLIAVVKRVANSPSGEHFPRDFSSDVSKALDELGVYAPSGMNIKHFIRAAYDLNIPHIMLPGDIIQYGYGKGARLFKSSLTDEAPAIGTALAKDKSATSRLLRLAGLPAAEQIPVRTVEEALAAAQRIGYPVVIKPTNLDQGKGVFSRITTDEMLDRYFPRAKAVSNSIVVEKHFPGENYRVNVIHNRVSRIRQQAGAHVVGNGKSTIIQLVDDENRNPRRNCGRFFDLKPLKLDEETIEILTDQQLTINAIPEDGRKVWLAHHTNASRGGAAVDVTNSIHPDNAELCVKATALLGLDISGVDLIIEDISVSHKVIGCLICEINATPQIGRVEPFIHDVILSEYVKKQCDIKMNIAHNGNSMPYSSVFSSALDRSRERINFDFSIIDAAQFGIPFSHLDDLTFDTALMSEAESETLHLLVSPFTHHVAVN